MFKWAYDLSGNKTPVIQELYIASGTAIEYGEVVKFTPGTGVEAVTGSDFDDPAIGVAMEDHDGSTDGRQSGNLIKVSVSPTAVYKVKPREEITATGGSTTTFEDSNLEDLDDLFNDGKIEIVSCAADSDLEGKIVSIDDYTGSSGTITLAETLPAELASGDTAYLCPGPLAISKYAYDLNSDGKDIDWETDDGEALQIVGVNPDTFEVFVKLRLHQYGDDADSK